MQTIDTVISAVMRRIRLAGAVRCLSYGLLIGAVVSFVVAIVDTAINGSFGLRGLAAIPLGGLIAALFGYWLPVSRPQAAKLIDDYYRLKDRAVTAIQFDPQSSDHLRQLQLADAAAHLRQVNANDCVSVSINRRLSLVTSVLAMLAISTTLWLHAKDQTTGVALPLDLAVEQASLLRESMLPEIDKLRSADEPEIDRLAEELEALVKELETESIDEFDMMAKLSEMEQSLSDARDAMQSQVTDAEMKEIAAALQPAAAMKAAAMAMESGDYEAAKNELDKVDPDQLTDKERRAVADNLKKFVSKLSPGREGRLSVAAKELQEGLEEKDSSKCKDGICKLATECKSQCNCKKIGECLSCQLNRLAQCKSACKGGSCNKNGGDKVAKSDSPSSSWGTGKSGSPNDGEASKLASSRHEEKIESVVGEGVSESEFLEAPEGEQLASRSFTAKYNEFRRQAEAVLDSEPLPIGHRETVRTYFESIRPGADDAVVSE